MQNNWADKGPGPFETCGVQLHFPWTPCPMWAAEGEGGGPAPAAQPWTSTHPREVPALLHSSAP